MRKIEYPNGKEFDIFKNEYLRVLDIADIQSRWEAFISAYPAYQLDVKFSSSAKDIILADYGKLCQYYTTYVQITKPLLATVAGKKELENLNEKLSKVFDYTDRYADAIAGFFIKYANKLTLSVCHYCEMSYVHAFDISDKDYLTYINIASDENLKKKFGKAVQLHKIKSVREVHSLDNFKREGYLNKYWRSNYKFDNHFPRDQHSRHFDVDHVLDKGTCPLVSLSLMNFVPACQVCNSRMKHVNFLGYPAYDEPKEFLSPTSSKYDFDGNVNIRILPKVLAYPYCAAISIDNPDDYTLLFESSHPGYRSLEYLFKLESRYQFHKAEGLYWIKMKTKYTDAHIQMISDMFRKAGIPTGAYTFADIKEDIFQRNYDKSRKPVLAKLKRDVLK